MDWTQPKDILNLIPRIRSNEIEIDPPRDHFFALKTESGYFVRWNRIVLGCQTTMNVKHAARMDNLLIAAAMALFWKSDASASEETIFVEAVRLDAVENVPGKWNHRNTPTRRHWHSENSSLVPAKDRADEIAKIKTEEEEIRVAVSGSSK